jgi:hypothetical protein
MDEKAYDEFYGALVAKDDRGRYELELSGRVLMVAANTRVLVLELGFLKDRVRILEGQWAEKVGYVTSDWVK